MQWELDVSNEKIGSGNKKLTIDNYAFTALLDRAESQSNRLKAARDTAILRLLHDLALQISSMVRLNAGDVDLAHNRIFVLVAGNKQKFSKILPSKTAQALKIWLFHRGGLKGPLFTNCDHAGKGKRLTATSIYRVVRQLGREVGIETSPLGIRQTAIIKALGKARTSGIRLEDVAAFSDHRHVSTLKKYDRQRAEVQQRLSDLISE